jgi:hypothetical protein
LIFSKKKWREKYLNFREENMRFQGALFGGKFEYFSRHEFIEKLQGLL